MKAKSLTSAGGAGSPGATIRALRRDRELTLAQVSERTGLAASTLSKLEKGTVSLSYDKLMLLSKGLGVDLASLIDPKPQSRNVAPVTGRRAVHRVDEGQLLETRSYRQRYLATELLNKKMTPMVVEIRSRTLDEFKAEFGDLIRHPGEEFTYVLEGELEFHSELYAPLRLRAGESIYFDSEMGHAYLKASVEPCRLVCACAPRGHDDEVLSDIFISASGRHGVELAAPAPAPSAPPARVSASAPAASASASAAAAPKAARKKSAPAVKPVRRTVA